jgi:cytochrome c2
MRFHVFAIFVLSAMSFALPAPAADPAEGEKLFRNYCAECHSLNPAEPGKRGPHLAHLFERRYGAVEEGFPYRMIWKDADPVWTKENLDDYLEIHRIPEPDERAHLIEYLFEATGK